MRALAVAALLAALVPLLAAAHAYRGHLADAAAAALYPAQWYTQRLDHFDALNTATFQQRFYENKDYFAAGKASPIVLLYINGEGPVPGPPSGADNGVVLLAQQLGAAIVTLEHRYYGKSVPFTDLSTDNLRFLSSKQALFDLAEFVLWYSAKIGSNVRIINVGGSYSGALAAWFRLKFPHVTMAAWSSSGVVDAILDFVAFDEQVALSAGPACAANLRTITAALDALWAVDGGAALLKQFQAPGCTQGDFFYINADAMAESVQYGYQADLCEAAANAVKGSTPAAIVAPWAAYVLTNWTAWLNPGGAVTYCTPYLQDTSVAEEKNGRQWWFQKCSEVAYFQNAPATGSIRSASVNMSYHQQHCNDLFGGNLWPDVDATNAYYGAKGIEASNVVYMQGSQDPWQRAGIESTISSAQQEMTITCMNCGHCVDLRGCPNGCTSTSALATGRKFAMQLMSSWIGA